MRMELMMGDELDDGRFIVTSNSRVDIPIGTVFTVLFSRAAKFVNGELQDQDESPAEEVALKLAEVQFWRKPLDVVPCGHHAVVRLAGAGLSILKEHVAGHLPSWYIFLGAD